MSWTGGSRRPRSRSLRRWERWAERKRRSKKRAARREAVIPSSLDDRESELNAVARRVTEIEAKFEQQRATVFDLRRNGAASEKAEDALRSLHLALLVWRKRLLAQQHRQSRTAPKGGNRAATTDPDRSATVRPQSWTGAGPG